MLRSAWISVFLALLLFVQASLVCADHPLHWWQYQFSYNLTEASYQALSLQHHQLVITSQAGSDTGYISLIFDSYLEVLTEDEGVFITVFRRADAYYQFNIEISGSEEPGQRTATLTGQAKLIGIVEDERQGTVYPVPKSPATMQDETAPAVPETPFEAKKPVHKLSYLAPAVSGHSLYQEQFDWLHSPVTQELTVFILIPDSPSKKPASNATDEPDSTNSEAVSNRADNDDNPDTLPDPTPACHQTEPPQHSAEPSDEASANDRLNASAHRAIEQSSETGASVTINRDRIITGRDLLGVSSQQLIVSSDRLSIINSETTLDKRGVYSIRETLILLGLQKTMGFTLTKKGKLHIKRAHSCSAQHRRANHRRHGRGPDDHPPPPAGGGGDGCCIM